MEEISTEKEGTEMDRILTILQVLDHSKNAIFVIHTESSSFIGGNATAKKLFDLPDGKVDVGQVFGTALNADILMEKVIPDLMESEKSRMDDVDISSVDGEKIPSTMEFVLGSDDMEFVFLILRIQVDRRPVYLDRLFNRSKRPTFMLECQEQLIVRFGNQPFYKAFACNPENIGEKYDNIFDNFLAEETKDEDIAKIFEAIADKPSAILDIQVKVATGETLLFYYNYKKLKPLMEEDERCLFCQLVEPNETLEEVEYPYDIIQNK